MALRKTDDRRALGRKGEKLARKFLRKAGYRHLASNFAARGGEVDLIMQDGQAVVFVEVKTRRSEAFADGESAVNWRKQRHIESAARFFVHINGLHDHPCRFDVVAVTWGEDGKAEIRHYPSAFRAKH